MPRGIIWAALLITTSKLKHEKNYFYAFASFSNTCKSTVGCAS